MEKFGSQSHDDNVDTSFLQRRQEALAREGIESAEQIDTRVSGIEANDTIIEGLQKLNKKYPGTPESVLDMALSHIEQLRADNQPEELVREALNNFMSRHPALLKYLTDPAFGITDLPEYNDPIFDRYNL